MYKNITQKNYTNSIHLIIQCIYMKVLNLIIIIYGCFVMYEDSGMDWRLKIEKAFSVEKMTFIEVCPLSSLFAAASLAVAHGTDAGRRWRRRGVGNARRTLSGAALSLSLSLSLSRVIDSQSSWCLAFVRWIPNNETYSNLCRLSRWSQSGPSG